MNVLVVGSGGREHALCWSLAASPLIGELYCAPGNGGIADVASVIDIDAMDFDALTGLCRAEAIDFVVVGPEAPLCAGLVDHLAGAGIKAFGPSARAAVLEGSKGFAKDFCARHGIPTPAYGRFDGPEPAKAFIRDRGAPIVVKADGLAAGKGVTVARDVATACKAVDQVFDGRFGAAGAELVVEECLAGEEVSFFALVDGSHVLALTSAQDHKAVGEGDTGPNTGGMGAYSPAPILTPDLTERVLAEIVRPTVAGMAAEGRPYAGVLFVGLMITGRGPQVLEFNCRFGDPECQVLCRRLKSDLLAALVAATDGVLDKFDLRWRDDTALAVVMAANGYPGAYAKGGEIANLKLAGELPGITIFHAATQVQGGRVTANGGRVLAVTALGEDVQEARDRAYQAVDVIDWPGGFCRRDIGWRALERLGG